MLFWDPAHVRESRNRRRKNKSAEDEANHKEHEDEDLHEHDLVLDKNPDESGDEEKSASHKGLVYEQTLKIFSPVLLVLTPTNEPVKFSVSTFKSFIHNTILSRPSLNRLRTACL